MTVGPVLPSMTYVSPMPRMLYYAAAFHSNFKAWTWRSAGQTASKNPPFGRHGMYASPFAWTPEECWLQYLIASDRQECRWHRGTSSTLRARHALAT